MRLRKIWFRFRRRHETYYSEYLGFPIRIVKVIRWNYWVWERDEINDGRGISDYDVRKFAGVR